jgi:hypothetical protein
VSRIRSIHPGLFTDEAFMTASVHARMLVIGLWCEAFDDGVFEWKPLTLKARLFPVDAVDVPALLDEICGLEFIQRFEARGKPYGAIRNFRKFQRPKKPNSSGVLPDELQSYVGISSEPVPNQSPTGGEKSPQMEDGGGNTVANATGDADAPPPLSPVDEIWVEQVPVLTSLSGAKEAVVRQRVGKALSQFDPEAVRDAFAAAIAAKSGDPFAYATRVLIPNPKARGSPKQDCASAASDLAERLSDDTFAQPVARPMLTAVRG